LRNASPLAPEILIDGIAFTGTTGAMQLPHADIRGVFNMDGTGVANYVSILEPMRG
jgi:acetyl-CoA C-acetyltransferase